MRGHTIITNDGVIHFNKILDELRSSINDLISIAENMIPEDVLNKRLKEYLTTICKGLENENLNIHIEISEEFDILTEDIAINVYKIFKSLIQYLLNYTEAKDIHLTFSIQNNIILIKETDDGKNFNLSALSYPGINDLAEIKAIVEKMRGSFDILRKNNRNETNITLPQ
jgi:signal transduction histidine kinase